MKRPVWRQHRRVLKAFLENLVKHAPPLLAGRPVQLARRKVAASRLIAVFAGHIDKMRAVDNAYKLYLRLVGTEKDSLEDVIDGIKGVQGFSHANLGGKYGGHSVTLGLEFRRRNKPSPGTQVLAIAKSKATREARGTKGRKQKAKIKAKVTSAVITARGIEAR
jgi:hypothetical protein